MLTNVQPYTPPEKPSRITQQSEIRAALEPEIRTLSTPEGWKAYVTIDGTPYQIQSFNGGTPRAYAADLADDDMGLGCPVRIEGDRLVLAPNGYSFED